MLSEDKITAIFYLVDDSLKGIGPQEDLHKKFSDSELITMATVSTLYFGGHQNNARSFMKMACLFLLCLVRAVILPTIKTIG